MGRWQRGAAELVKAFDLVDQQYNQDQLTEPVKMDWKPFAFVSAAPVCSAALYSSRTWAFAPDASRSGGSTGLPTVGPPIHPRTSCLFHFQTRLSLP